MKLIFSSLIATVLLLTGCLQEKTAPVGRPMVVDSKVVATVNGVDITQAEVDLIQQARQRNQQSASIEESLEEAISMELMRQKAATINLQQNAEVAAEINRQATNALISRYIQQYLQNAPVTAEEVKAEYDRQVAQVSAKEYKSRHILMATEEEALAVIAALNKGADFIELANEKSVGPSANQGGDLGWASPDNFVAEFGNALQALKPGEYSKVPVKTQFGWHVILLEEIRDTQLPDLEAVKPQLERMLITNKIQQHIEELRKTANIKMMEDTSATKPDSEATMDDATTGADTTAE